MCIFVYSIRGTAVAALRYSGLVTLPAVGAIP